MSATGLTLFPVVEKQKRTYTAPIPKTSKAAYESVDLDECSRAVLEVISQFGAPGCTADMVESLLGYGHQRIIDLVRKGLIIRTNRKRTTRAGRDAFVFIAARYNK